MVTATGFTSSKSSLTLPKLISRRPSHHSSSFLIFRSSTTAATTILTCSSKHRRNTIPAASFSFGDGINGGNGSNHGSGGGGGGGGEGKDGDDNAGDKDKAEGLIALAEMGRSLESLPKDLAAAIESGRIPKSIVLKYLELEKSPMFRWLLQFGGFRERLLADDLFLAKIGMECGVGIFTKTAAEYDRRRENFFNELEIVIADVVMAIIADFMLVYLPAPTVSLRPPIAINAGRIAKFFYSCPDNAFQVALGGTSFTFLQRIGAIMRNGAKLFAVGTSSSLEKLNNSEGKERFAMKENKSGNGNEECNCGCHDNRMSFPPGYRFNPSDEELIVAYLKKKVMNQALPYNETMRNKIMDLNIYKLTNPEILLTTERYKLDYGEQHWYFFTPRDRKYPNGDRPNREAGIGYWKATGADKAIMSNKVIVGYRKALVFHIGKPHKNVKTNWIMHEYVYNGPARKRTSSGDMKLDDWVLSRIYKKCESKSKEKKEATVGSEGRAPAESALVENQISQGGNNAEDDGQLTRRDEDVDMIMNHHVEQQQQPPFLPNNYMNRTPQSENIPQINYVPTNEINYGFPPPLPPPPPPPPPPPQWVPPLGFRHPSMYPQIKSGLISSDDYYIKQNSTDFNLMGLEPQQDRLQWELQQQQPEPLQKVEGFLPSESHPELVDSVSYLLTNHESALCPNILPDPNFWDGSNLMGIEPQQPQRQWILHHHQQPQQNVEGFYEVQSEAEFYEGINDLVTNHERFFGPNNPPDDPHDPLFDD